MAVTYIVFQLKERFLLQMLIAHLLLFVCACHLAYGILFRYCHWVLYNIDIFSFCIATNCGLRFGKPLLCPDGEDSALLDCCGEGDGLYCCEFEEGIVEERVK